MGYDDDAPRGRDSGYGDDRRNDRSRSPARGGSRLRGVALRWNDRGFGFIKPDDGVRKPLTRLQNLEPKLPYPYFILTSLRGILRPSTPPRTATAAFCAAER